MKRSLTVLSLTACVGVLPRMAVLAQASPVVTLARLDCGTNAARTGVGGRMSDTYAFSGLKVQLTFSCYLVRNGDEYMLWDTGNPVSTTPTAPKTSLVDLPGQRRVTPDQVK